MIYACKTVADSTSKQPRHHWGCGWVAVREIAWSAHDPHLFCTMGNDTTLRIWDIREPRACLRAHRLVNFTFGLALLWLNPTTIFVSTDQGSIFGVDPLTGMQRLLLAHPHLDSPVWSCAYLQTKVGNIPVMLSACASGSILQTRLDRLSTKRSCPTLFAQLKTISPQHLSVSFEKIARKANAGSGKRTFPDRNLAIHRVLFSPDGSQMMWAGVTGLVGIAPYEYEVPRVASGKTIGRPRKYDINSKEGRRKKPLKYAKDIKEEVDDEDSSTSSQSDDGDLDLSDGNSSGGEDRVQVQGKKRAARVVVSTRKKPRVSYVEPEDIDTFAQSISEDGDGEEAPLLTSKIQAITPSATAPPKRGRPKKLVPMKKRGGVMTGPLDAHIVKQGVPEVVAAAEVTDATPLKTRRRVAMKALPPSPSIDLTGKEPADGKSAKRAQTTKALAAGAATPSRGKSTGKGAAVAPRGKSTGKRAAVAKQLAIPAAKVVAQPLAPEVDAIGEDAKQVPAKSTTKAVKATKKAPVAPKLSGKHKAKPAVATKLTKPRGRANPPTPTTASPSSKKMVQTTLQLVKKEPKPTAAVATTTELDSATSAATKLPCFTFAVGQVVQVAARTNPGINKLGGAGFVKAIYPNDGTVDVKYVLGGQERGVPVAYVTAEVTPTNDMPVKRQRRC
ncbi:hypothetical protein, variant [Aphanomyces astaci]|uniref:Uncharacterized protein n=1 Tax=Aphanomyces astaci TaxID=112090 RepID=W4GD12_APHAT|nr:hypothetical protein, variant [Aphanomyces astaci]ETV77562.1 hypothetical protein, variant [Aphanomyces astaci]|eukprot:XP_009832672.1 hypothetical protein, variant [Aphanomyces astaci]